MEKNTDDNQIKSILSIRDAKCNIPSRIAFLAAFTSNCNIIEQNEIKLFTTQSKQLKQKNKLSATNNIKPQILDAYARRLTLLKYKGTNEVCNRLWAKNRKYHNPNCLKVLLPLVVQDVLSKYSFHKQQTKE